MANTKIIVIQMKEIIYTALFIGVGIILIILLVLMFKPSGPGSSDNTQTSGETAALYNPGTYTSELALNNTTLNLEVIVDSDRIKSVRLVNLEESVATMFPLLEPSLEEIETQLISNQSIDNIQLSDNSKYTQTLLVDAISAILDKAAIKKPQDLQATALPQHR